MTSPYPSSKRNTRQLTMQSRRRMLQQLAGMLVLGSVPTWAQALDAPASSLLVGAYGDDQDQFGLAWTLGDLPGQSPAVNKVLSGFRGHSIVQHPRRKNTVLLIARRPGTHCIEVDVQNAGMTGSFQCKTGHHFFGHACFTVDGQHLITTEAHADSGQGFIVIRDSAHWQVVAQFPSGGIGPHELALMPDGKTLVVANGGILTHPDSGRKKLNLASMRSSLAYLDVNSGKILGEFRVPEPKASIRHLTVAKDGAVVFATQMQRSAAGHDRTVALGGVHKAGGGISLFETPVTILEKMNDYMGSVALCQHSRIAGFTSPRGNVAAFWHIDSGEFAGYHRLRDVCGIGVSADQQRFILSSSVGQLRELDTVSIKEIPERRRHTDGVRWDNHLLVVETT